MRTNGLLVAAANIVRPAHDFYGRAAPVDQRSDPAHIRRKWIAVSPPDKSQKATKMMSPQFNDFLSSHKASFL